MFMFHYGPDRTNIAQYKAIIPLVLPYLSLAVVEEVVSEPKLSSRFFDISSWTVISNAKKILVIFTTRMIMGSNMKCRLESCNKKKLMQNFN